MQILKVSQLVTEIMQINLNSKVHDLSISELVKWILSVCLNIQTLQIDFPQNPNSFSNEIARLKKLKKLNLTALKASDLKEVTLIALRIKTTLLIPS
jgi:hypothetical protein